MNDVGFDVPCSQPAGQPEPVSSGLEGNRDALDRAPGVDRQGAKRMFSLVTDLALLEAKIKEIGNVVLVVIDPMSAYLGVNKLDAYRTSDVRGVLTPLAALAENYHCAIIGVMHFNKNSNVNNAMLRLSDSLAFVAAPRHAFVVIDQPDTESRLFAKAKNNLAPVAIPSLAYSIKTRLVGIDKRNDKEIWAPYVVWEGYVKITADEALAAAGERPPEARDQAKEVLQEILAHGPVPAKEVYKQGREAGCSEMTLRRAAKELGIKPTKDGVDGPWLWKLTEPGAP
jgi:putative DNA primase/helicase